MDKKLKVLYWKLFLQNPVEFLIMLFQINTM